MDRSPNDRAPEDPRFSSIAAYSQDTRPIAARLAKLAGRGAPLGFPAQVEGRDVEKLSIPAFAFEQFCDPGYRDKRPDKGYLLAINNYIYHPIEYNESWRRYAYIPYVGDRTDATMDAHGGVMAHPP